MESIFDDIFVSGGAGLDAPPSGTPVVGGDSGTNLLDFSLAENSQYIALLEDI